MLLLENFASTSLSQYNFESFCKESQTLNCILKFFINMACKDVQEQAICLAAMMDDAIVFSWVLDHGKDPLEMKNT